MRVTRDEWTQRVNRYFVEARDKATAKKVAQELKRIREPRASARFKATERYSTGWVDSRAVYGSVK